MSNKTTNELTIYANYVETSQQIASLFQMLEKWAVCGNSK